MLKWLMVEINQFKEIYIKSKMLTSDLTTAKMLFFSPTYLKSVGGVCLVRLTISLSVAIFMVSMLLFCIVNQGICDPEWVGVGYSQMKISEDVVDGRGVHENSENKIAEGDLTKTEDQAHNGAKGTRANPIPINEAVDIGNGWGIRVLEVYPNANDMVAKENKLDSLLKKDQQYFLARIELEYTGPDSSEFDAGYRFKAVGPSSVVYSPCGINPNIIPDELKKAEAFTGGIVVGNIGWAINSSDAEKLVMYDSRSSKDNRIFLALY